MVRSMIQDSTFGSAVLLSYGFLLFMLNVVIYRLIAL